MSSSTTFSMRPRGSGYRAVLMQIVLDDGMTAEIQILPRPIMEVYGKGA
jgi:hypothetical protein